MLKTKSALSYFGSDSEVAADLAEMLNHCSHVTIPFCGGLSILPHLKARAILANDAHLQVINFYRHASGCCGVDAHTELLRRCEYTLSHPAELALALELLDCDPAGAGVQQAWAMWAVCWIGRKGKGGTKHRSGMPSVRRTANGGTNATRLAAAAADLHEWTRQFLRCEWQCVDFRELLPKVADRPDCGLYCDPPWMGAGSNYLHAFNDRDHVDLAERLSRFEATTVVVRYGDHPLIRQYYSEMGWTITEATSRDQANATQREIWITNKASQ